MSHNPDAAHLIGLELSGTSGDEITALLNGTLKLEGSEPYAMCYFGHQFGHYVPRLGDGRAINLGVPKTCRISPSHCLTCSPSS